MKPDVRVAGVCERDIDLLLLEEFAASPAFCGWFLRAVGFRQALRGRVIRAERSATVSNGESDLEVTILGPGARHYRLLIENKVGAQFQPRQAERYLERGEAYVRRGYCHAFRTVLVAPKRYLGPKKGIRGFDAVVSYEAIRAWFARQARAASGKSARIFTVASARAAHKIYLLSAAIEKGRHGWQKVEDAPITRFWRRYWELASEKAPELQMPEPSPKPSKSSFIYFRPADLPRGLTLVHKAVHGNVDLQFSGMGHRLPEMSRKYRRHLKAGMEMVRAAKSAAIRIKVPRIRLTDVPDAHEGEMTEGIRAAQFLLEWYLGLPKVKIPTGDRNA